MSDPSTTTDQPTATQGSDRPADGDPGVDSATLVDAELLVEEISIDGMCGVY
ncbi:MAG TPA: mycofactocin precursor MftA [Acidimicrobiales bacterium]|jgi:mycofactocin precursor|nr:mycofactocin precursor MftA [Acidimicrobiales bacterium]